MVHELPDDLPARGSAQVTARSFGPEPVRERVAIPAEGQVVDMRTGDPIGAVINSKLKVQLDGYSWASYAIQGN